MFSVPSNQLPDNHIVIDIDYDPFPDLTPVLRLHKGATWSDKLDRLAACNCCARHQNNKPKELHVYHETETNSTATGQQWIDLQECECSCRHMARWICRLAKEDEDGYIIMPKCHYTTSPPPPPPPSPPSPLDEEAM